MNSRKRKGHSQTMETEYKVVRKKRKTPIKEGMDWIGRADDPPGFLIKEFSGKGRGVVTSVPRTKDQFLLVYRGEEINAEEGDKREERQSTGFRFFFKSKGKTLCVDASKEDGSLGRLVNHGKRLERNATIKDVAGHLCLFASRDISVGEELLYDYGIKKLPWEDTQVDRENNDTGANMFPEIINIITSGLGDESLEPLEMLSQQHDHVQLSSNISTEVSHVIMSTDPIGSKLCPRTYKFLWGIAHKCWILDYEWVLASLNAGKTLPEADYEVVGEESSGKFHYGPRMSRTSDEQLFSGYQFILHGFTNNGNMTLAGVSDLIIACGGKILEKEELSQTHFVSSNTLVILQEDVDAVIMEGCFEEYKTVCWEWIVDCITKYQVLDTKEYMNGKSIEDQDYVPEESFAEALLECNTGDDFSSKDPDYIPRESSSATESMSGCDTGDEDWIPKGLGNDTVTVSDSEASTADSEVLPMLNQKETIFFQGVGKNSKGNPINKLHACFYCEKVIQNIARHLESVHSSELEVGKILSLPKKSKERRKLWEVLVNKGDFAHNFAVMEKGKGIVIPKKRSDSNNIRNLIPCQYCKALYKKKDMWKHSVYCVNKGLGKTIDNPVKNGRLLLPLQKCPVELSKKVLNTMRDDEVRLTVETDDRIIDFGRKLYEKHGHEQHKIQYISQKLRELGRLLIVCRAENAKIKSIDDLLGNKNWDLLINCVKILAGYNFESHAYAVPSLALKIGHSLQKCARYMRSEGIKQENDLKISNAENFLKLYDTDWIDISSHALISLEERKYNKPNLLPIVEDVVKMNKFLISEVKLCCENIEKNFENKLYSRLAQLCLAQVILFNRRRSGETERMTLKALLDAENGSGKPDPVVLSTLNEFEKKLCSTHTRVEIKGKRNRKVAILLTEEMKKSLQTLVAHREKANVVQNLLFSKPGESRFPYRGSDCLRKFAKEAGVENSYAVTSTKLRKQLATLAQILNLSETSQDILATFQGHDIRVHRQFYRLPEDTMQIAKVTKILHSLNNGTIGKYEGKDFDEIQLAEKDFVESETESSETGSTDEDRAPEMDREDQAQETGNVKDKSEGFQGKEKEKTRTVALKVRHHWTMEEKSALKRQFMQAIAQETTPGQLACINAIRREPCLANFQWRQVKFAVKNLITTYRRQAQKGF